MNAESFKQAKEILISLVNQYLHKALSKKEIGDLNELLILLDKYNYDNRLRMKGTLTRTIVDSYDVDYLIGSKFMEFDSSIN